MIFHHPGSLVPNGRTGSQVRPYRMLEAFKASGFEVEAVVGYGAERRQKSMTLLRDLAQGRRFDFLYSEARSIPTLLTERHRLPLYPLMDFRFLGKIRAAGVPVGLFYRDVFWRFEQYRNMLPSLARMITIPLYWYDWWWYRRVVDHLFLPSVAMAAYLPTPWSDSRVSALPPGSCLRPAEPRARPAGSGPVRLLYIGGVNPPTYDLSPLFACIADSIHVRLTLCCRAEDWEQWRSYYPCADDDRIEIVHATGEQLTELYARADLFALLRSADRYLDFAVPVKLFEAIGYGLPIATVAGTEAARLVAKYDLGWVVDDAGQFQNLMGRLGEDPSLIPAKRAIVRVSREQHSWQARVREIASTLTFS